MSPNHLFGSILITLLGCPVVPADDDTTDDDSTEETGPPDYSNSPCWGEGRETDLYDQETHTVGPVDTSCRAEDEDLLVYVQDTLWEDGRVTQEQVDTYTWRVARRAQDGARDTNVGILANDIAVFGEPDWDGFSQGKVALFVVDLNGSGDGYLCGWCTGDEGKVLHVDGGSRDITDEPALSVTAHELVHLIEHAWDDNEEPWLAESEAEAGMTLNGYYTDTGWVEGWLDHPDQSWGPDEGGFGAVDYGAALLFGTWILEAWGEERLGDLLQDEDDGWDAVLAHAPAEFGSSREEVWAAFAAHVWRAQWLSFDFGEPRLEDPLGAGEDTDGDLSSWGIDFVPLQAAGEVAVTVFGNGWFAIADDQGAVSVVAGSGTATSPGAGAVLILLGSEDLDWEASLD